MSPYVIRVHWAFYHITANLHPEEGVQRQYAQLYVMDTTEAVHHRLKNRSNSQLSEKVLRQLDSMFKASNLYARSYKM